MQVLKCNFRDRETLFVDFFVYGKQNLKIKKITLLVKPLVLSTRGTRILRRC